MTPRAAADEKRAEETKLACEEAMRDEPFLESRYTEEEAAADKAEEEKAPDEEKASEPAAKKQKKRVRTGWDTVDDPSYV